MTHSTQTYEEVEPTLDEWLALSLYKSGLTQSQLAKEAGVSRSLVSSLLSGTKTASLTTIVSLARALKVNPAEPLRILGIVTDDELISYALGQPRWSEFVESIRSLPTTEQRKMLELCSLFSDIVAQEGNGPTEQPT